MMGGDKGKARPVIPETMRAAVVEKFREPLQIREVPVPCSPAWSRAPRVAVIRCCKIRPNSRCAGSDDYAGYMLARHIKPKKIVFHSRLLPHETCRMNRVQHLKTKKRFLVFSDSGFMTYQPQT